LTNVKHRFTLHKKASELARKQKRKMTKKLKTRVWDAAENLETDEDMAAYLEAA
jgi:hypothetical protein